MAVSLLQPVSTSEYSLPSRNRDDYQAEKMTSSNILVSSPYSSSEHHLDLSSVPETSQQLALALEILRPLTEEYPSQPYSASFNWQEIVDRLPNDFTGEFYCIAFYSTLHPNVDTKRLHYLDSLAHAEANKSGGLLKYWWRGPPDSSTRKNLATCIWTTWDHAKRAGRLPMHAVAMSATRDSYAKWNVERYYLKIASGNKWKLERITL